LDIPPVCNATRTSLNLRDAAKNIAIFGETGTGKTTRVINHLLVQALDFDCGGLSSMCAATSTPPPRMQHS